MRKRYYGFSLIELLIVVTIIGILAVITIPNYYNVLTKSKIAATISNMNTITKANVMYSIDWGTLLPYYNADYGNDIYFHLTTPIPYISNYSVFIDKFFTNDEELRKDEGSYFYDLTLDYAYSRKNRFFYENVRDVKNIKADLMILKSQAPDRKDSIIPTTAFILENDTYDYFALYNATNGLYSEGDIVYTPFGIPNGLEHYFNRK